MLASGEIEVDTRGALVRWMVTPYPLEPSEPDVDNDFDSIPMLRAWEYVGESCVHLAGQSGLPFDRLWMWLRVSSLSEWLPEEHSDLIDYLLDLNGTCMVDSVHVTWPSEMHADPNLRPPIEVSGDFCLLKASAVSDGTLNEALTTARDYIVAKRALRALEAANPDTTANPAVLGALAAARTRMRDMYALRTIRQASRERKVASNLLGFTRAAKQRSVSYERLYPQATSDIARAAGRADADRTTWGARGAHHFVFDPMASLRASSLMPHAALQGSFCARSGAATGTSVGAHTTQESNTRGVKFELSRMWAGTSQMAINCATNPPTPCLWRAPATAPPRKPKGKPGRPFTCL